MALGLSGGPDSMTLLELLLHHRDRAPFELHLIHIDHGWREESAVEAQALEKLSLKHQCTFHFQRLNGAAVRDVENAARQERFAFFKEVMKKTGAEALCLAHHGDDLAETVLKRLFEGAPLERLGAFGFETKVDGLRIWRPLICLSKQEISAIGFDDATNRDRRFLRARMRLDLIPEIERHFGKGIRTALQRLSKRAHSLDAYLKKRCERWLGKKSLPLEIDFTGAEPLEIEYVLSQRADVPANLREELSHILASKEKRRTFEVGKKKILAHSGLLSITEPVDFRAKIV